MKTFMKKSATTIAILLVLLAPAAYQHLPDFKPPAEKIVAVVDVPVPVIEGDKVRIETKSGDVGQLIRLRTKGDDVTWTVLPWVPDHQAYDHGESFVVSFRQPGRYSVIASVSLAGKAAIRQIELVIGDTPTPEPSPNPEPGPKPVENTWDAKFANWIPPAGKTFAPKLAGVFEDVAGKIQVKLDKGELLTAELVIEMTLAGNRAALTGAPGDWTAFRDGLSSELQRLAQAGSLTSMPQHKAVWLEIAAALRRVK